jgi:hypothetical protein
MFKLPPQEYIIFCRTQWDLSVYRQNILQSETLVTIYSTLQVYQRSYSQVRHIPPKMSYKFESQHSLSPTIWSDVRVEIKSIHLTSDLCRMAHDATILIVYTSHI